LTVLLGVTVARAAPSDDPPGRAAAYLVQRQSADGSWGTAPNVADVADAAVGLVSGGVTETALTKALTYLADHGPAEANRATMTARVLLAAVAGGRDPRNFGKVDYVGRLRTYYNPSTGAYGDGTDANSYSILALVAANDPVPDKALTSLEGRQCSDGGFPRATCIFGSDVASTALAVTALVAGRVGASDPVREKAGAYLRGAQNKDGGFGPGAGQPTAAQPTGAVLSALVAMQQNPGAAPWKKADGDPLTALVALQDGSGGLRPNATTAAPDDMVTATALPGLAGLALPVRPASATPVPTTVGATSVPAPATATTRQPAVSTTLGRTTRTSAPIVETPSETPNTEVRLAAPARGSGSSGRSFLRLLPFLATLFGAGSLGVFLRRRARI
jgi:hypothetical protein